MNPAPDQEHFVARTYQARSFAAPAPDEVEGNGALEVWTTASGALEWRSRICPLPKVDLELTRLFKFWERQVLPVAGGLYEQPQIYLEAMEIFEQRLAAARPKEH